MVSPRITEHQTYDVVVIGCGLAGACAGLRAAERGATVVILETAPIEHRGGQTRFSKLIRLPLRDTVLERYGYSTEDTYSRAEFFEDIVELSGGAADRELVRTLVEEAGETINWLTEAGVIWEGTESNDSLSRSFSYVRHKHNEGKYTLDTILERADAYGAEVRYETTASSLEQSSTGAVVSVIAETDGRSIRFDCGAVVIAAGGYESNSDKRAIHLGPEYEHIPVRGCVYNTGEAIDMALAIGAKPTGNWGSAHITIIDSPSPDVVGGDTKISGYPFGVILNLDGERFVDEGADEQAHTYAKYGRKILEQPGTKAFVLFDSQVAEHVESRGGVPPTEADTVHALAENLGIRDVDQAVATVSAYNEACNPGRFEPSEKDGNSATAVHPPKSNWALPLDRPPYFGYPVTAGITFTYGGIGINRKSEVIATDARVIPGLYAAGTCTGGFFSENYPGGTAQTVAAVFGKRSGEQAAKHAL